MSGGHALVLPALGLSLLAVTATACAPSGGPAAQKPSAHVSADGRSTAGTDLRFRTDGHRPRTPPADRQPWSVRAEPHGGREGRPPTTADGVQMYAKDGRLHEHPVRASAGGLKELARWRDTDSATARRHALAAADRLVAHHRESRGAWYFPYTFGFPSSHKFRMRAPWYSGMAQGMALSLFSRLAREDGVPAAKRTRYRTAADRTFDSLLLGPEAGKPWVSHVDKKGYLWLEEYPQQPPDRSDFTFNGHNYATAGVWDYHRTTGDPRAARLFDGALTTSAHYGAELRRPGRPSSYCVHHNRLDSGYHGIVTRQLLEQYWLSGSKKHLRLHRQYLRDHRPPPHKQKDDWLTPEPAARPVRDGT